jgi:hypothetical protein
MKTLFFVFALLVYMSSDTQAQYTVEGQIGSFKNEKVYLIKGKNLPARSKWQIIDSVTANKGKFSFKGKVSELDLYSVTTNGKNWFNFILENKETVSLKGDSIQNTVLEGSLNNRLHENFEESLKSEKVRELTKKLNTAYDSAMVYMNNLKNSSDSIKMDYFARENQRYNIQVIDFYKQFIKDYPKAFYSLYLMKSYWDEYSEKEVKQYLDQLPPELKKHTIAKEIYAKAIQEKIDLKAKKSFYEMDFVDMLNKKVDLKRYEGNYVLLDFWAS